MINVYRQGVFKLKIICAAESITIEYQLRNKLECHKYMGVRS